ncbi:MAG: hypothetical protein ABIJ21_05720 [Nanoarchaeota archaeon]
MIIALIMVAVLVVFGIMWARNSYASAKKAGDIAACNVGKDFDADGVVNSLDQCKCDHEQVPMVAMMEIKNDEQQACSVYRYKCTKTDGQWLADSKCVPTRDVAADFVDQCAPGGFQTLDKMLRDANGAPVKFCPTDAKACEDKVKRSCEDTYS